MNEKSETLKTVYPLYLVIDCSGSMDEQLNPFESMRRIDFARNFPLSILHLYESSQDLVAHLRVSVFIFNSRATQVLPLSSVTEIGAMDFNWEPKGRTFFANLFKSLKVQIEKDRDQLSSEFDLHNPAIVVVTDGIPSNEELAGENPESRRNAHKELLNVSGFNQPVQILMFGIGMASQEFLDTYATSKNLARKADPSKQITDQMKDIVLKLKETIRQSLLNRDENSSGWLSEALDKDDDLWDDGQY
jgi:uncharacterized protein YegL